MASVAASDDSSESGGDQVDRGVGRIRDTAKWLVAGFGALGSALIASLQLSSLGKVTGDSRELALTGFGISIFGVLVAMVSAAWILVAARVSLDDINNKKYLSNYVKDGSDLLGGYSTFKELDDAYRENARTRIQAFSSLLTSKYKEPTDPVTLQSAEKLHKFAEGELSLTGPVIDQVLGAAVFEKVRYHWAYYVLPGIVVGIVLAAVGAGIFAANSQAADSSGSADSASTSTEALIRLTAAGQQRLGSELGAYCSPTDIQVLVLKEYSSGWLFETIGDYCKPLVFNASNDDVIVEAELQPCPLPSSTSSSVELPPLSSGPRAPIKIC